MPEEGLYNVAMLIKNIMDSNTCTRISGFTVSSLSYRYLSYVQVILP